MTIYNVQFILAHAVVTTAVPVDDDELGQARTLPEEEVVKAAKTFLEWDGIDVSRADAIEVEKA